MPELPVIQAAVTGEEMKKKVGPERLREIILKLRNLVKIRVLLTTSLIKGYRLR